MSLEGRDEKGKFIHKNLWHIVRERIGKPKKYPTPEELASKALEYFDWCAETKNKITFAGFRVYVDFSRTDWHNYKNNYPDYLNTINTIENLLEAEWEGKLGWAGSTQGAIFWLKNKAGWKDEITQNQNQTVTTVQPTIIGDSPKLANDEKQIDV
jgi:isopenicillin N synthase-like dioxygenase